MNRPVFNIQYFGDIHYYYEIQKYSDIFIEAHEHYIKQTIRNRTYILTANGTMPLIIPVIHQNNKENISQKEICYKEKWHKKHYTAIISAYKNAPYFEYYADDLLRWLINPNEKFLFQFNLNIFKKILSLLDIYINIYYTSEYTSFYTCDYRDYFKKNIHLPRHLKIPYLQVFSDRFSFQENRSILDLIFNLGPHAKNYLKGDFKF